MTALIKKRLLVLLTLEPATGALMDVGKFEPTSLISLALRSLSLLATPLNKVKVQF
ncbi:MAG: hypothetical protein V7K40_28250 [Nostoc sp.]|uniref:hypothetical protein n=1 Tax=Nostoc sp. TaxID=1180 RepID=UPI002FF5E0AF